MKITFFPAIALLLPASFSLCPAQDIPLPAIPNATFAITDFGAIGDGKTTNTAAIEHAVATAVKAGGGTVLVPAGKFLTGPFTLASGIDLHLAKDAVILITDDLTNYPLSQGRYVDAMTAKNSHDLKISGEGTIDGQGQSWWAEFRAHPDMTHRPYLIEFSGCQRVEVMGVTLQNSPMFHLVPQDCTDVTIRGVTIHSPADAPNTDGIDPSGWNFLITQCVIDTGDDNIAIKPTRNRPPGNKNYLVSDCQFFHGHGMSVGSGTFGGVEDLTFRDCAFDGTDSGIRIKSGRDRGGLLQHLVYENLTMTNVKNPVYINDYYPESTAPKNPADESPAPITATTPVTRDITIRNVTASDCPTAGTIRGLPEMPVANITFSNVNISAKTGMKIYRARGILFVNSSIKAGNGKSLDLFDAEVTGLP